jgi:15-cis-phytoene desaturase
VRRVLILGGGIAGLSAAHELAERGFDVEVHERRDVVGGKARSIAVPGSGEGGRRDLPGEHGFRFFPRFYRHLDDAMARIPFGANRRGVLDNLVDTTRMGLARPGQPLIANLARFPRALDDLRDAARFYRSASQGIGRQDVARLASLLFCVAASSEGRREEELDGIAFAAAAGVDRGSFEYQALVGLTEIFVALRAEEISAKTTANVALQMWRDLTRPGASSDRVLAGPTSDAWLEPWREQLLRLGVRFRFGSQARRLHVDGRRVTGVEVACGGRVSLEEADHYVMALPVEVVASLLDRPLLDADPSLRRIHKLAQHTRWMVGIQYFLRRAPATVHGHVVHLHSPWALTSVMHQQFWPSERLAAFGAGDCAAVLSVDISAWDVPGANGRTARASTPEEIGDEVWAQLAEGLGGAHALDRRDVIAWHLDPGFHAARGARPAHHDEPLFVNAAGSWRLRPEAATAVENLVLAGDWVRTHTDLACMEGANESARRAVNAILTRSSAGARRCAIYPRPEPALLAPLRRLDAWAHARGLPFPWGRWPKAPPIPWRAPAAPSATLERGAA